MKLLFTAVTAFLLASCAPAHKVVTKRYYPKPFEFQLVDTAIGSKNELYVKAHEWIARTYGSAKAVIDMQDKEAGKIIGKCLISDVANGDIKYLLSFDIKDGKYRCRMTSFHHEGDRYWSGSSFSNYKSYGYLNQDSVLYVSPADGKKRIDQKYYSIKNFVMDYSDVMFTDLKKAMHAPPDKF